MSFFAAFIYRQFIHYPPAPSFSFRGKTVIVTGSNVGLGKEACRTLVRLGASQVIIACRNLEKGKAAAEDIQSTTSCPPETLQVWHLDNSSYASVQSFADKAKAELPRLDALILNAGIGTRTFRRTEDNEETITTNVVSLTLLACLLHPKLRETAQKYNTQTHITVTSSELYEVAKFKERNAPPGKLFATLADEKQSDMGERYHVSKLLEMFVVRKMAELSPLSSSNVIINSVAPGLCDSELAREVNFPGIKIVKKIFCRPAEVGARTLVYGAGAGPESHGGYLPDCKLTVPVGPVKGSEGAKLQDRVWKELSEKLEGIRPGVSRIS